MEQRRVLKKGRKATSGRQYLARQTHQDRFQIMVDQSSLDRELYTLGSASSTLAGFESGISQQET
jgi:hypothetical protein